MIREEATKRKTLEEKKICAGIAPKKTLLSPGEKEARNGEFHEAENRKRRGAGPGKEGAEHLRGRLKRKYEKN